MPARAAWIDTADIAMLLGIGPSAAGARMKSIPSRLRVLSFGGKRLRRRVAPVEAIPLLTLDRRFSPEAWRKAWQAAELALQKWEHTARLHGERSRRWRARRDARRRREGPVA